MSFVLAVEDHLEELGREAKKSRGKIERDVERKDVNRKRVKEAEGGMTVVVVSSFVNDFRKGMKVW